MAHRGHVMADQITSSSGRRHPWRLVFAALVTWLVIQSITITLPIRGRVVDAISGQPVPNAAVAALWRFDAWTPVDKTDGGTARLAQAITDRDGAFGFPVALLVHTPLLPFSTLMRADSEMPMVIVMADGYHPKSAKNDVYGIHGPRHAAGFLSVRTSSLENVVLRIAPLPQTLDTEQRLEYQHNLDWARNSIAFAVSSCAGRWYCRSHSLAEVRAALERGSVRVRFNKATLRDGPR